MSCENSNCEHNVYIQPPKGILQKKCERFIRSNIPMLYESEQKLSYKKHPIQNYEQLTNSSVKTICLGDSLKFCAQNPAETTQHLSYKKWETNKSIIKKPKDCVNLLGSGPINLITTQQIEFQKKTIPNQQSKECV